MQSVTVTIGRNVPLTHNAEARRDGHADTINGQAVLNTEAWQDFTSLVKDSLVNFAEDVNSTEYWVETHDGLGEWEGVTEESRKVTLLYQASPFAFQHRPALIQDLLSARTGFYQDAVAVSFGDSTLV